MRPSSANRILFALLSALLAVTSIVSARLMTPQAHDPAHAAYLQLEAYVHGDLCGIEAPATSADHQCPFCHGLPKAPEVAWAGRILPIEAFRTRPALAHLLRGARDRDLSRSPRGPPVRA